MASANLPIGSSSPPPSASPSRPAKVELVEQLILDGVTFSAHRQIAGYELPLLRRLPAPEVLEKLGRQTVYCTLPGFLAVPLGALEDVAALTGKLPPEQARSPELAATVRTMSEQGWTFGEQGTLGAYQVLLEQGTVRAGLKDQTAVVDASGLERLQRYARSPALELEAAGLKFFDASGEPGRGLDLFERPDLRVGLSEPGESHDLHQLRAHYQRLGGDLKAALGLASSLQGLAEKSPAAQAFTLKRQPSAAARLIAAEQLSSEQISALLPQLEPRDPEFGTSIRDALEPIVKVQHALLERLSQLPEATPSVSLALELSPLLFDHEALKVQKAALEGQEPARVLAHARRCNEEACQKALELASSEPSLAAACRLGRDVAGPEASVEATWTAVQIASMNPPDYAGALLEELRWSRSSNRSRDSELVARNLLARLGDSPVGRLGKALTASLSGEPVAHVVRTLSEATGPEQLGELAVRALPGRASESCVQAVMPWLDQGDPAQLMTRLIKRAEAIGPSVGLACERVLARFESAEQVLALLPSIQSPPDRLGGGPEDDAPLLAAQARVLEAVAKRLQDFPQTAPTARLALVLADGCASDSARDTLMIALSSLSESLPSLAARIMPWKDAGKVEQVLSHLESEQPELGETIAQSRAMMQGCTLGGTWAVARAYLEHGRPPTSQELPGVAARALEHFDALRWPERDPDQSALVGNLLEAVGERPSLALLRAMTPNLAHRQVAICMRHADARRPHELAALGLKLVEQRGKRSVLEAELSKLPGMSQRLELIDQLTRGLDQEAVWPEAARLVLLSEKLDADQLREGGQDRLKAIDRLRSSSFEDHERLSAVRAMLGRIPEICTAMEVVNLASAERTGAIQEKGRQVIIGGTSIRRRNVDDQGP